MRLPMHRTIVVVDVAGFTDPTRTLADQLAVHEGLYDVLTRAFAEADIDLAVCTVEDRGDGAMILLPADIPKNLLADRLPGRLVAGLKRYNAIHSTGAGVQLRVGLHAGEVRLDEYGAVSPAINFAFRILEAPEAKRALKDSASALALIASDRFYLDVIQNDPAADAGSYRQISVVVKETSTTAWLRLTGGADVAYQPGSPVPQVWGNVPPRNPNFTGRMEVLDQLSAQLADSGTTAVLPAALLGMGGIGKTQIAVEYVYRHLPDYEVVWWIQAATTAQVRTALTELANQLRLPGSSEAPAAVSEVLEALRLGKPHRRWLLVFDAAESPDTVRHLFPTNGPGKILVTSRNADWVSVAGPLEVAVFHRDESVELLKRRGPAMADDDADRLADKLGDLPLAVDQAAAWRAETGMPVQEYLRLFDEKVAEILDTHAPIGYEVPVAAAWNVSFDELATRNVAAHQLLQVCAFFSAEPIPRGLFTGVRGVSISPELDLLLRDSMQLSRAVRDIKRYGLAKIDHGKNTLQLHRLVQLVLRDRMAGDTRAGMRHGAHELLASYDPNAPRTPSQWVRYQNILPHVYESDMTGCANTWVQRLVINLMQFLYFWGEHTEAISLARRAVDRWTELLGEDDPHVLEAASYLGLFLWVVGRYPEAAQLNELTLERHRRASAENSEETVIARLRVVVDTRTRGDFLVARTLGEQIYEQTRDTYGDDDPITLQTAHDLAVTLRLCGEFRRAFELNKQTSERRAEVLGFDSTDTLNTLSGMYMDRRELGDYVLARKEHEQIAQRVQELLGEDKADSLRRFAYLSVARRKDGDYDGALELSDRVLARYRRRYGESHPHTMSCSLDHSNNLRAVAELDASRTLGERIFSRYRTVLGEQHPFTMIAAVDLAVTLRLSGDATAARRLDERALGQLRIALGADHPFALSGAINLASDLAALDDHEAAHALGAEVLDRVRRILGADHPTTVGASLNHALDLRALGHTREAEAARAGAVAICRRSLGETHPMTAAALDNLRINCDLDPFPL